jgi:hypothetical protein
MQVTYATGEFRQLLSDTGSADMHLSGNRWSMTLALKPR